MFLYCDGLVVVNHSPHLLDLVLVATQSFSLNRKRQYFRQEDLTICPKLVILEVLVGLERVLGV